MDSKVDVGRLGLVNCASLEDGLRLFTLVSMVGPDPAREGGAPTGARAKASGPGPAAAPKLVLLVDDDPDILESYARLIEHSVRGVRVRTAPNPQRALELLRSESFALIVSDYRMPGMNGLDFLSEARRLQPDAVRILVSAYPDRDLEVRARAEVGPNFLSKASDPSVLIHRINVGLAPSA